MFFCLRIQIKPFICSLHQFCALLQIQRSLHEWLQSMHDASVLFTALYPQLTLLNMMCRLSLTSCSFLVFLSFVEATVFTSRFDISLSVHTSLPYHALLWELTGRLPLKRSNGARAFNLRNIGIHHSKNTHLRTILLFKNTSWITRRFFLGTFLRTNVRNNVGRYWWMRPIT